MSIEVTYKAHMGSDDFVCDMARVSFDKVAENFTKEQNNKLLAYLARHNHWSPFAHPQVTLHVKCPIFVARQDFKHVVGFARNEVSRRYVDDEPEFYDLYPLRNRPDGSVKQGSGSTIGMDGQKELCSIIDSLNDQSLRTYNYLLESNVAPEQARAVLPQSMYTSYYVTGSLAAWARAYKQRAESTAQLEIQNLAKQWDSIIAPLFPVSWSVLTEN